MYYSSNKQLSDLFVCKKHNDIFQSLDELYQQLNKTGWCEMTTFSKKQWNPQKRCSGQCNATVLLVQEYFGGDIIEYDNPPGNKAKHFFNRIDGVDIDLTSEQFSPTLTGYSQKSKKYNGSGMYHFVYEKSEYILKLRLGLQ